MKILILANKPPYPTKDGSSLATLSMAMGLAQSGIDITILAISTQKHKVDTGLIPKDIKEKIRFEFVNVDTRINPFKGLMNFLFSSLPYNIERFINNEFSKKLTELLTFNSFDIIQIEGLYLIPYTKTIKQLSTKPVIYRSHNIENEIWTRLSVNQHSIFRSKYYASLAKRITRMELDLVNHVDALVAITNRDLKWFKNIGFSKPSCHIPMGYDDAEPDITNKLLSNSPCFIGSLDWLPNQEGLFWFIESVWPIVLLKLPDLEFHIAGRNAPKSLIDRIIKHKNIIYHGEVENAKGFLSGYSTLVVPLLSGSGMRVKIVEGMMLGKVIITTPVGIEGIDVQNLTQAIIAESPVDFAKAIVDAYQQPELRVKIAEKARTFAIENYDINKLTAELLNFYKTLS